jgi:hypothetical protein
MTVARFNTEDFKPDTERTTLWQPGDHLISIVGAEFRTTKNGKEYLALTMLNESGHTYTESVFGMTDNGKGPWVQRVTAALALAVGVSLPPVEGVDRQPWQTFDWELSDEVQAALIGGVCWIYVDVEEGEPDGKGGTYAAKNRGRFLLAEKASHEQIVRFRASDAWQAVTANIREIRTKTVEAWKTPPVPTPAAKGVKGDVFSDDGMPF